MDRKIILVGAFHEMIELCCECGFTVIGIIDNEKIKIYHNIPIIGKDSDAPDLFNQYSDVPIVLTPDAPVIRKKLSERYQSIGFTFQNIISPSAKVSSSASLGCGVVIQSGVNISSCTTIGNFVKLNTNANIMHDCIIRDYVTVAPNAVLLGYVDVGVNSYIGANSTVLPYKTIGKNAIVGAAAVVTKNVDNYKTVKGNPAK